MTYLIRTKIFNKDETKVISNSSFKTNDKEFAENYVSYFPVFEPHSFILKTECNNFWQEIKSWFEWTFILKK
jgi:hypothetical protein